MSETFFSCVLCLQSISNLELRQSAYLIDGDDGEYIFLFFSFFSPFSFFFKQNHEMGIKRLRLQTQTPMMVVWNRIYKEVTPEYFLCGYSELYISLD